MDWTVMCTSATSSNSLQFPEWTDKRGVYVNVSTPKFQIQSDNNLDPMFITQH
jgi:hypothetical protein